MMATHELPNMLMPKHAHTVYKAGDMTAGAVSTGTMANTFYGDQPAQQSSILPAVGRAEQWEDEDWSRGRRRQRTNPGDRLDALVVTELLHARQEGPAGPSGPEGNTGKPGKEADMANKKRIVRVIIVDPHDDIPVGDAILYKGDDVFTDKTDQELFFDIPITKLLEDHNSRRVKVRDRKASRGKEREELLEPARIRDLDMVVLTIAEFGA